MRKYLDDILSCPEGMYNFAHHLHFFAQFSDNYNGWQKERVLQKGKERQKKTDFIIHE